MRARVFIVCLLLVLLPLRGWAQGTMQVEMLAAGTLTATAAMPCHPAAASAPSAADAARHAACAACDLCHAAVALFGDASLPAARTGPVARPAPLAAADTGRQNVGVLERPPRSLVV